MIGSNIAWAILFGLLISHPMVFYGMCILVVQLGLFSTTFKIQVEFLVIVW